MASPPPAPQRPPLRMRCLHVCTLCTLSLRHSLPQHSGGGLCESLSLWCGGGGGGGQDPGEAEEEAKEEAAERAAAERAEEAAILYTCALCHKSMGRADEGIFCPGPDNGGWPAQGLQPSVYACWMEPVACEWVWVRRTRAWVQTSVRS